MLIKEGKEKKPNSISTFKIWVNRKIKYEKKTLKTNPDILRKYLVNNKRRFCMLYIYILNIYSYCLLYFILFCLFIWMKMTVGISWLLFLLYILEGKLFYDHFNIVFKKTLAHHNFFLWIYIHIKENIYLTQEF